MAETDHDTFLTKRETAAVLGCKWWTIDRLRRNIAARFPAPYYVSQSSPRWSRSEVVRWMRDRALDPRRGA